MTPASQALDHDFAAPIEKDGTYPTFVTVPGSADLLGTRRPVKVVGTVDGRPFAATLMPSGDGPHWLPIKKSLSAELGDPDAGSVVSVHLEQRLS